MQFSGAHSIGDGFKMVRAGEADVVVAGGTEACVDPVAVAGFARMRALSTARLDAPAESSRPFDADRRGGSALHKRVSASLQGGKHRFCI